MLQHQNLWYIERMTKSNHPQITHALQTGIIVGFVSTAIGSFIGVVTTGVAGAYYIETSIAAITVSAMSFGIVTGLLFHFLEEVTTYARDIITTIGLTIPTVLSIFVLSADYYDTAFKIIATSVSYAVVLSSVILIPMIYHSDFIHHSKHLHKKHRGHGSHHK